MHNKRDNELLAAASISVSYQLRKGVSLDIMTFRTVIQKMNFYLK